MITNHTVQKTTGKDKKHMKKKRTTHISLISFLTNFNNIKEGKTKKSKTLDLYKN